MYKWNGCVLSKLHFYTLWLTSLTCVQVLSNSHSCPLENLRFGKHLVQQQQPTMYWRKELDSGKGFFIAVVAYWGKIWKHCPWCFWSLSIFQWKYNLLLPWARYPRITFPSFTFLIINHMKKWLFNMPWLPIFETKVLNIKKKLPSHW